MTALVRERRPARNRTPVALAIVALALAGLAWWRGGPGLFHYRILLAKPRVIASPEAARR